MGTPHTLLYEIGLSQRPSVNSRKKRFVNPIEIEVTQSIRIKKNLGKASAMSKGHHHPRAVYSYKNATKIPRLYVKTF